MTEVKKPFHCPRCQNVPNSAFAVNTVTDDWIILYPEENLIHFHFGPSTDSPEENDAIGEFAVQWWDKITKQYPEKRFFFITDLSRKDDAEVIEGKTREALKYIRSHSQDGGGAAYGYTWSMGFLLNLVGRFTRRAVNLRRSYAECEADYKKWVSNPENMVLKKNA